jgi:galactosamine-6-phosphate isomerase
MKIEVVEDYAELSQKAKKIIFEQIGLKKNLLLCAATGASPTGTYQLLAEEHKASRELFEELRIIKLDEWGGIPMEQSGSCEAYIQKYLLLPLQISTSRYIGFKSNASNPKEECKTIQEKLANDGPIDLCILGLGTNGHLALNEPGDFLQPHCHISELTASSLLHPMALEMEVKPTYGLTLGIADIFSSKMIILIVSGSRKKAVVSQLLSGRITNQLPASFLWLHPNVVCLIERDATE